MNQKTLIKRLNNAGGRIDLVELCHEAANHIEVLEAQIGHPCLHLLGLERTGWQRYIFGRWVYNSEPFRRDIQRSLAAQEAGE
jgi:hypothetical protein